jgi:hypothetical protein
MAGIRPLSTFTELTVGAHHIVVAGSSRRPMASII